MFRELHVLQTNQTGKVHTCVDVGDGGQRRLDGFNIVQDDDVSISLEVGQLRQVVVQRVGDVFQIDADGVTDAETADGVEVKFKGFT